MTEKLKAAGVSGPAFVSVGDPEKLNKFLELNPKIPRDSIFVDDSSEFDAYTSKGFGKIGDVTPASADMKPPGFSMGQWWSYISNVMSLSPVPKDLKFGDVPQGVLVLGGTFAIDGDDVVFAWSDSVPGAHPEVSDVVDAIVASKKSFTSA